ncbi:hypothetical protein [Streptomyces sp. NPDC054765]
MTHTKKALIATGFALVALGAAALPAAADNHIPSPPHPVAIQGHLSPVTPLDNHAPVASLDNHRP